MNRGKSRKTSLFILLLLCVYLLLPLAATLLYSLFSEWSSVVPTGFTLNAYRELFADAGFWASVGRTVVISILPVAVCTLFVLLAMYVVVVYLPGLDRYMQLLCTIPYAMQGVILAISVLSLYADAPGPLSNRVLMLTSTYCIVVLPYVYQGIKNALFGVNAARLIEAAQMLGASRLYAYFRVVVPNIFSGVTVSAMLAMAIVFGDFVVINTMGGGYFHTAQMYLYEIMKKSGQRAGAVIVVLFVVTLLISAAVFFLRGCQTKEKR